MVRRKGSRPGLKAKIDASHLQRKGTGEGPEAERCQRKVLERIQTRTVRRPTTATCCRFAKWKPRASLHPGQGARRRGRRESRRSGAGEDRRRRGRRCRRRSRSPRWGRWRAARAAEGALLKKSKSSSPDQEAGAPPAGSIFGRNSRPMSGVIALGFCEGRADGSVDRQTSVGDLFGRRRPRLQSPWFLVPESEAPFRAGCSRLLDISHAFTLNFHQWDLKSPTFQVATSQRSEGVSQ